MSDTPNNNEGMSDDDYYDFHFQPGGYIPSTTEDSEDDLSGIDPDVLEAYGYEVPQKKEVQTEEVASQEVREVRSMVQGALDSKETTIPIGLLSYYKDRIEWKAPKAPFPPFESMTANGKGLWLLMLKLADNDHYGTTPSEFFETFPMFLSEFFTDDDSNPITDPDDLSLSQREALSDQLGIGDFLLTHPKYFKRQTDRDNGGVDIRYSSQ